MAQDWFTRNAPPQTGGDWFSQNAPPPQVLTASHPAPQGLLSSFADTSGLSLVGQVLRHPINSTATLLDAGKEVFTPAQANIPLSQSSNPLLKAVGQQVDYTKQHAQQAVSDFRHGRMSNPQLGEDVMKAIPIAGSVYDKAASQADTGNYAGAAGTVLGLGAGLAGPEYAAKGLQAVAPAVAHPIDTIAKPLRSGLDEPLPGTSLTPRARYTSAKRLGVQLDAADATNSPTLKMAKAVNQHSLPGAPTYEASKANNLAALQSSTNDFLTSLYGADRESGGAAIQTALRRDQHGLQSSATEGFESLPGDLPIPGSVRVGQTAQEIANSQAGYQEQFPSLVPKQANSVVGDVSGLGPKPLPPGVQGPQYAKPANFGTMQQLRSDLLELGRTNPDLVKNQGGGWLQRLAGATDDAMTDAGNGLPPELQPTFRDANGKWADMKSTYDDPSSPLYHAVRTDSPSTLYSGNGLGPRTPEAVRDLMPRLGQTSENLQPQALGALRRGVVESALKTTNDGSPNFKGFGTQLNRIPADYRAELYTLPQNQRLNDIVNTSNLLSQDLNPSGSAKQLQKFGELSGLVSSGTAALTGHPLPLLGDLAYNGAQYGAAKLINSPRVTEFLMRSPVTSVAPARSFPFLPLPVPQVQGMQQPDAQPALMPNLTFAQKPLLTANPALLTPEVTAPGTTLRAVPARLSPPARRNK